MAPSSFPLPPPLTPSSTPSTPSRVRSRKEEAPHVATDSGGHVGVKSQPPFFVKSKEVFFLLSLFPPFPYFDHHSAESPQGGGRSKDAARAFFSLPSSQSRRRQRGIPRIPSRCSDRVVLRTSFFPPRWIPFSFSFLCPRPEVPFVEEHSYKPWLSPEQVAGGGPHHIILSFSSLFFLSLSPSSLSAGRRRRTVRGMKPRVDDAQQLMV